VSQCLLDTYLLQSNLAEVFWRSLFLGCEDWWLELNPALCDWKVESRRVPERMSIWFWESKLNLNSWDCLKIGNPKCWLIVTSQYLCHYFPINSWSIHDFQTRRPSPGGLSDGVPVCVWYLCTQTIQKRHEETWRNTVYIHIIDIDRSIDREDTPIHTPVNMNPHRPHKRLDDHSNPRHLRPLRAKVHLLCATWFTCSTIHYLTLGEKRGVGGRSGSKAILKRYGTHKMIPTGLAQRALHKKLWFVRQSSIHSLDWSMCQLSAKDAHTHDGSMVLLYMV
jgi:hypothetical protein